MNRIAGGVISKLDLGEGDGLDLKVSLTMSRGYKF